VFWLFVVRDIVPQFAVRALREVFIFLTVLNGNVSLIKKKIKP
jgi:hypothetical protein